MNGFFPRFSLYLAGYIVLMLGVAGAFLNTELERRTNIQRLNTINRLQCNQIEKLKAQHRSDAREDYANLDKTLELLGLERTPEIERTARQNRDITLRRFSPGGCPDTIPTG